MFIFLIFEYGDTFSLLLFHSKLYEVASYCLSTFTTRDGTADHDFESYLSSSFTASEQEEMR